MTASADRTPPKRRRGRPTVTTPEEIVETWGHCLFLERVFARIAARDGWPVAKTRRETVRLVTEALSAVHDRLNAKQFGHRVLPAGTRDSEAIPEQPSRSLTDAQVLGAVKDSISRRTRRVSPRLLARGITALHLKVTPDVVRYREQEMAKLLAKGWGRRSQDEERRKYRGQQQDPIAPLSDLVIRPAVQDDLEARPMKPMQRRRRRFRA